MLKTRRSPRLAATNAYKEHELFLLPNDILKMSLKNNPNASCCKFLHQHLDYKHLIPNWHRFNAVIHQKVYVRHNMSWFSATIVAPRIMQVADSPTFLFRLQYMDSHRAAGGAEDLLLLELDDRLIWADGRPTLASCLDLMPRSFPDLERLSRLSKASSFAAANGWPSTTPATYKPATLLTSPLLERLATSHTSSISSFSPNVSLPAEESPGYACKYKLELGETILIGIEFGCITSADLKAFGRRFNDRKLDGMMGAAAAARNGKQRWTYENERYVMTQTGRDVLVALHAKHGPGVAIAARSTATAIISANPGMPPNLAPSALSPCALSYDDFKDDFSVIDDEDDEDGEGDSGNLECSVCQLEEYEEGELPSVSHWDCNCVQHKSCIEKLKRAARSSRASVSQGVNRVMNEQVDQYCPLCRHVPLQCIA